MSGIWYFYYFRISGASILLENNVNNRKNI
jgi:hypothetical protein